MRLGEAGLVSAVLRYGGALRGSELFGLRAGVSGVPTRRSPSSAARSTRCCWMRWLGLRSTRGHCHHRVVSTDLRPGARHETILFRSSDAIWGIFFAALGRAQSSREQQALFYFVNKAIIDSQAAARRTYEACTVGRWIGLAAKKNKARRLVRMGLHSATTVCARL